MSVTFSPEQFYDNARYLIALEMGLPYLEKIEPEKGESTLFALLVYIASKDNSLDNETISSFYRVFLQDILARTKDGVTASRYQTFLNEAITKFNAVPLASDGTTDVKALAETADELISLTENETADVMAFVNNNRATLYTLGDVFVPTVEPAQVTPVTENTIPVVPVTPTYTPPPAPVQPPLTHAQQSGAPAQGISGVATYTPADFAQQPTQTENTPLSHAQQSGMASQSVSGVATYTPADFAQPVTPQPSASQPQPVYTAPPVSPQQAPYTPAQQAPGVAPPYNPYVTPAPQVQYTNPQFQGSVPAVDNPLNKITGWLLLLLVFVGIALLSDLNYVISYLVSGQISAALLTAPSPILSGLFIAFVVSRNKNAYLVFIIERVYFIIIGLVFNPSSLPSMVLFTLVWGTYLLKSERVKAVLGPFTLDGITKPKQNP